MGQSGQKKGIARGGGEKGVVIRRLITHAWPLLDEALQSGVQFGLELKEPGQEIRYHTVQEWPRNTGTIPYDTVRTVRYCTVPYR